MQTGYVATIGFFDGVHIGHRYLIGQVKDEAQRRHLSSLLVTFRRHPRQVMQSEYQPQLLSTFEEKCRLLEATGVDACSVLDFDRQMAGMSAYEFMRDVLQGQLGVSVLVVGYDHRFGHGRTDSFEDYGRYGKQLGIEVVQAHAYLHHGVEVSSSVIRTLLSEGEVTLATQCLGDFYRLEGRVVNGYRIGHELGYPTANIAPLDGTKLIPKEGAYVVRVFVEEMEYGGMLNVGVRPTIDNGIQRTIEVHLFDFIGDLYGKTIRVAFVSRLRDERKFRSMQELSEQLAEDEAKARQVLNVKKEQV